MKSLKIYLIIVSVLLVIALGFGVYVWYMMQGFWNTSDTVLQKQDGSQKSSGTQPTLTEPITIKASDVPVAQRRMLETLGYTQDTFTITPAMVTCAEDALGRPRLAEIFGGSAPTPLESLKLLPCFK